MHEGAEAGLAELEAMPRTGLTDRYPLLEATRGEILRRAGRHEEAAAAFEHAAKLPCSEPEREFLLARIRAIKDEAD